MTLLFTDYVYINSRFSNIALLSYYTYLDPNHYAVR